MPVQVQLPGFNHAAPGVALAQVIGAGFSAYKDYNQAQQEKAAAAQAQAATAQQQQATTENARQIEIAKNSQAAMVDPNSVTADVKRAGFNSGLNALRDTGIIKSTANKTAFDQVLSLVNDQTPGRKLNAMQIDQLRDSSGLNDLLAVAKGQQSIDAAEAGGGARKKQADVAEGRLNETKNENAISAGQMYDKDPIIHQSKVSQNSLKKSLSIINNSKKPVTTKDLNLAYTDYINAVAAGGAATEGKIGREMPETWAQRWNELRQNAGENEDLRKSASGAQLIKLLKQNISTVQDDINKQIGDQAASIHTSLSQSTNPKVVKTSQEKLKQYTPTAPAVPLDADLSKMNPAQLKTYIQTHGGS